MCEVAFKLSVFISLPESNNRLLTKWQRRVCVLSRIFDKFSEEIRINALVLTSSAIPLLVKSFLIVSAKSRLQNNSLEIFVHVSFLKKFLGDKFLGVTMSTDKFLRVWVWITSILIFVKNTFTSNLVAFAAHCSVQSVIFIDSGVEFATGWLNLRIGALLVVILSWRLLKLLRLRLADVTLDSMDSHNFYIIIF